MASFAIGHKWIRWRPEALSIVQIKRIRLNSWQKGEPYEKSI